MTETGILFTAPMVRALLAGTKTQTRRVVKPRKDAHFGCVLQPRELAGEVNDGKYVNSPYGAPGDSLWVRETFLAYGRWETRFSEKKRRDEWHFVDMTRECDRAYQYAADNPDVPLAKGRGVTPGWHTRPAIFMPRAASRITLEIVSVRVERLKDISQDDAQAEGITDGGCVNCGEPEVKCACSFPMPDYRDAYCHLWEQINGAGSWAANPWVWVVEFKRIGE